MPTSRKRAPIPTQRPPRQITPQPTPPATPRRAESAAAAPEPPLQRRLSDKVLAAFHAACDENAIEIAGRLFDRLEVIVNRPAVLPAGTDRRQPESLAGPRERLANLVLWSMITRCRQ